jgi:hypothetical protein
MAMALALALAMAVAMALAMARAMAMALALAVAMAVAMALALAVAMALAMAMAMALAMAVAVAMASSLYHARPLRGGIAKRRFMKEKELRECATCSMCHKKIGRWGLPVFYRLKIERFAVDLQAVRRQAGLEGLLDGHVGLAQAFSTEEEMARNLMEPMTIIVCEGCSMDTSPCCVAMLAEKGIPTPDA